MVLSFLFFAFLAYLVLQVVTKLVLPVYRTTKKMREVMRAVRNQAQGHQPGAAPSPKGNPTPSKHSVGDYIDFEEVKD